MKASLYSLALSLFLFTSPSAALATNLYYEFDIQNAFLSYEADITAYSVNLPGPERDFSYDQYIIGNANFNSTYKPFTPADRLILHIDTDARDLNLYGLNRGTDSCLDGSCMPENPGSSLDQRLYQAMLSTELQFGIKIFEYDAWANENDFSDDGIVNPISNPFNAPPVDFAMLEADPSELFADGIWNSDSWYADNIAETAGAGAGVNLSSFNRNPVSYESLAVPNIFTSSSPYSIDPLASFFHTEESISLLTRNRYLASFSNFKIDDLGGVSFIGNSLHPENLLGRPALETVANPEPTSILLFGLIALGIFFKGFRPSRS